MKRLMFNLTVLVVLTVAFGTAAPSPASPPSILAAEPSPTAPTVVPPKAGYVLEEERVIGSYAIRLWLNPEIYDNILTISAEGQTQVEIPSIPYCRVRLMGQTGTDITGEGHPDVVIEVYTGGAHCCFSTIVYDLGPTLTKVLETPLSNCSGHFQDIDGDGIPELITCDDLFAYVYCCFAGSPAVTAVLQYEPGQGYVPASPRFPDIYSEDIAEHQELAEAASPGEMCEWSADTKCSVLPLVLDYLYSGQVEKAWSELDRLYNYPDAVLFRSEIEQAVSDSPLFVSAGPMPADADAPPYYMLRLFTNCNPDWQFIGLLTEGQSACDPAALHRDIIWLESQLTRTDLLSESEYLEIAPEGCTTNCRLDVLRWADDSRQGSIRLETTGDFPGEVYRVNGSESAHWRLRGDLTWEMR